MPDNTFYWDDDNFAHITSTGAIVRTNPKIFYQSNPTWRVSFKNNAAGSISAKDVSSATAWASAIDVDFVHSLITGALYTGYSGAVTSIRIDGLTSATPPSTGVIRLTNGSAETESIAYSALTENGTGDYTFTVSTTLTYTYAEDDTAQVENTAPVTRTLDADIDDSSAATGLIDVAIDADTSTFLSAVGSNQFVAANFELRGLDGSGNVIYYAAFPVTLVNTVDPDAGGVSPAPASNYYTKAEVDSLSSAPFADTTAIVKGSADATKLVRIEADGITTATTRVITMPDEDITLISASSTKTLTNTTLDANGTGNSVSNIDVEDLSDGTDGELITWGADGSPATVAVGTAGHVLTSNGAGAAPTFQASAGGGGYIDSDSVKTDNYTILDTDTDKRFILGRATAADKTFTLPTLADNLNENFYVKNMSGYLLTVVGEQIGTDAVEAGTTTTNITATGHSAVVGCMFNMTSGDEAGEYRRVSAVVDADNFTLESALSGTPTATETFELREAIDGEYSKVYGYKEDDGFRGTDDTNDEWTTL